MRCYEGKPEVNAGKSFLKVDVKVMGCTSNPKVTHSLLTILIVLLIGLMFVLLYYNRRKVQTNVKPLIDNFHRSMQYKTIEKVRDLFYYLQPLIFSYYILGYMFTQCLLLSK